jgi:hypothetical protein
MKKLLLTILALLFTLALTRLANAQSGVVRLEFPAEIDKTPYEILPLKESGILFFNALDELTEEGNRNWYFAQYDTNLVRKWDARVPVLDGATYQFSQAGQDKVYLFFINTGKIKGGGDNYQLSELEFSTGIVNHYTGLIPGISEVKGLIVHGNTAVIACNTDDEQAVVHFIDIQGKSIQSYICPLPDQNFVEDLRFNSFNGSVMLLMSNFLSRKQEKLRLVSLDMKGTVLSDLPVEAVLPSKFLNSARICAADPSNVMVIGTYGNYAAKIPGSTDYYGIESAGFFVTRFKEGVQQYMNYYNFLELQNLRTAISAKDYMKLSKKKTKEEPDYSADYELLLHPIESVNGYFVNMAESYYPDFRTVSDISYDYWGRPITHTYTVFEGFRIFQSILLAFDMEGNLLWDNSLDLSNINTTELSWRAGYFFDGKPAILYFNDGVKITFRAFAENAEIEGFTYAELDTSESGDKVVELGDNFMVSWYGNNFLCFGYHTIRNSLKAENEKRTVFYINKIVFE